jgi:hypothetical protein
MPMVAVAVYIDPGDDITARSGWNSILAKRNRPIVIRERRRDPNDFSLRGNRKSRNERRINPRKRMKGVALSTLHHVIDLEWMKEACRLTRRCS